MYAANYTSDDFGTLAQRVDTVVIPVGSLEAHGHHLPLGTDIFAPRALCERLEARMGGELWIAPEIPYGVSYDLSVYPGTVTMPSEVLGAYAFHVGESFLRNGVKNVVFLNGHGGNVTALGLAAERLSQAGAVTLIVSWWLDYAKTILEITTSQGHAGEDETACMLAYDETLVQMDKATVNNKKIICNARYKDRGRLFMTDAITGDGRLGTKEKGERIFDAVAEGIAGHIRLMKAGRFFE